MWSRVLLALTAAVSAVATAAPLPAVDYYVSPFGDDFAGDGSPGNPWRSITRAISATGAGDRVIVGAGLYDTAAGEGFPIQIPDGVAILGPPVGSAILDGTNVFVPLIVVTDNLLPTVLQRLRLQGEIELIEVFGNPLDFQVLDCVLSGGRKGLNHTSPGGPAGLTFARNSVLDMDEDGLNWEANDGSGGTHALTIEDNRFVGKALALNGIRVTATGDLQIELSVRRNTVRDFATGFAIEVDATTSTAAVGGFVDDNEFSRCEDNGVDVSVVAQGTAPSVASLDAAFRNNSTRKNGRHGVRLDLRAVGAGNTAEALSGFSGNLFEDNDFSGFYLSDAELGGGVCTSTPDLGGGASGSWGGNAFFDNDNGYSTGTEYDLRLEAGDAIFARGNWWGTQREQAIERHVFHAFDNPVFGQVRYSQTLAQLLQFEPVPHRVRSTGRATVRLKAGRDSAFMGRAGDAPLELRIAGRPVLDFSVSADGQTLSFRAPRLRGAAGTAVLVEATDPAGNSGTTTLELEGDGVGGGFCFVATAAYGDYEAEEVRVLRRWRDEHLLHSPVGRAFVREYYRHSPSLAARIAGSDTARRVSRLALWPVVQAVRVRLEAPWFYGALLALAATAWWRRRMRTARLG